MFVFGAILEFVLSHLMWLYALPALYTFRKAGGKLLYNNCSKPYNADDYMSSALGGIFAGIAWPIALVILALGAVHSVVGTRRMEKAFFSEPKEHKKLEMKRTIAQAEKEVGLEPLEIESGEVVDYY